MSKWRPEKRSEINAEIIEHWEIPAHMTPYFPSDTAAWQAACTSLAMEAASLLQAVNVHLRKALTPLLELMNCYYSNLIEGHHVFPGEVERAMRETGERKSQHALVLEAKAHIQTQRQVNAELENPVWNPASLSSLKWMHKAFTSQLPEELKSVTSPDGKTKIKVVPGEFRTGHVTVGKHDPPVHTSLPLFLDEFFSQYGAHNLTSPISLARIAAAHQRFAGSIPSTTEMAESRA